MTAPVRVHNKKNKKPKDPVEAANLAVTEALGAIQDSIAALTDAAETYQDDMESSQANIDSLNRRIADTEKARERADRVASNLQDLIA